MLKSGTCLTFFLLLLLIITSCRNKSKSSANQNSSNQETLAAFEITLNSSEYNPDSYDSLVYQNFKKLISLLDIDEQLTLYRKMGEFFYKNEVADSALVYFRNGLEIAKNVRNTYYTAVFHLMNGSVYTFVSDFEPALAELKTAYNLSTTLDSVRLLIRTSRNLGNVYWNMGNYDLALEYYIISLDISQKSGNKLGISSALNNIGNVYQEVKNYDRAIDYYKQSEIIAEKEGFARVLAISNNNLGDVFSIKGQYDSALFYFEKALNELKKTKSKFDAGIYMGNIANLYLKTDSLEKSKHYFLESLNYAVYTGDKTGIASCNLGLADLHLHEKKTGIAFDFLKTGTEISEEIGSLKLMLYAYKLNAQYYLQKKEYSIANHFLSRQMAVKDSIYSLENGENVANLENQYKEVKSLREIELLKEKQKNFINLTILGFSAFIIISLIIFIAYGQKTRSNQLLREKNLQIETSKEILEKKHQKLIKSEEQLNRLNKTKDDFLTIISHDLKNPLNSIRGFTELLIRNYDTLSDEKRKNFLHEVFDSIERINLLINNILFWVKSQADDIQFKPVKFNLSSRIEDNISIYNLMISNKEIELQNKVPIDIEVFADIYIFDMIIRNILSNSLKFTEAKGKIIITCQKDGQKVKLSISDNGIGIPEDKLKVILNRKEHFTTIGTRHEQGTGLGLGLAFKFINQTGGSFNIKSEPGKGTTVSFTFDVVI